MVKKFLIRESMQNLLDILYEQCLWNGLKYIGRTKLLSTGYFVAYSSDCQMIRNVGKRNLQKSVSTFGKLPSMPYIVTF